MSCKKGECKDCGFWDNDGRRTVMCHRNPVSVPTPPYYWCGEFVPRTEEEKKVVENKLESKKAKEAKAEAAQKAREEATKAAMEKADGPTKVLVKEPMSVATQPQSTQ